MNEDAAEPRAGRGQILLALGREDLELYSAEELTARIADLKADSLKDMGRVMAALKERYAELGSEIVGGTPAAFAEFLASDAAKWAKVVKTSGARAD